MSDTTNVDWKRLLAVGGVAAVLLSLVLMPGVGAAAAANEPINESAPYYDGEDGNVTFDSWMDGHETPSLANVTHYVTRVGGFLVGSDPSGSSGTGVLLTSLIVFGAFLGTTVGTNVGPVGGVTVGMIALGGLTGVGLAPTWLFGVALFGLGLVVARTFYNALQ